MKVGDVTAAGLLGAGLALGLALGLLGTWLARALPLRYEIDHQASAVTRKRRDAAIVVLSAALSAGIGLYVSRFPETPMGRAATALVTHAVLSSMLVTAAAIDLEHMILPHEITWGGTLLALATAHFRGLGIGSSAVGAIAGFLLTYLPFLLYRRLRGRSGMGMGDAYLSVLAGAWFGIEGALFVLFAGAMQSALAAVVMRIAGISYGIPASVQAQLADLRKLAAEGDAAAAQALADDPMAADVGEGESAVLSMRLPLGPFLALGCIEFLFGRRWIMSAFESLLGG
ncbi:MAG: prepilin peptidase [Deltaproteobacteria bacterium]|nr:prepilin peptidase [Deltaproteobacteria bacterium]